MAGRITHRRLERSVPVTLQNAYNTAAKRPSHGKVCLAILVEVSYGYGYFPVSRIVHVRFKRPIAVTQ